MITLFPTHKLQTMRPLFFGLILLCQLNIAFAQSKSDTLNRQAIEQQRILDSLKDQFLLEQSFTKIYSNRVQKLQGPLKIYEKELFSIFKRVKSAQGEELEGIGIQLEVLKKKMLNLEELHNNNKKKLFDAIDPSAQIHPIEGQGNSEAARKRIEKQALQQSQTLEKYQYDLSQSQLYIKRLQDSLARMKAQQQELNLLKKNNEIIFSALVKDRQAKVDAIVSKGRNYNSNLAKASDLKAELEKTKEELAVDAFDPLIQRLMKYEQLAQYIIQSQKALNSLYNSKNVKSLISALNNFTSNDLTSQQRADIKSLKNTLSAYCRKNNLAQKGIQDAKSMGAATKIAAQFLNDALAEVKGYPFLESEIKKMLKNMTYRDKSKITKVNCN